jgi:poly(3-hydroxybutyrate) depolymerase
MPVRRWKVRYRAHNGLPRPAIVLVPSQYGPAHRPAPLPLVISPHGRGVRAQGNAGLWGDLPARGNFVVLCPGGMGRRIPLDSWGYRGQIDDLARGPDIAVETLPWLRLDRDRVYGLGGSMGGQEILLLLGQHPHLMAGVAAFDSVANFYRRYREFAELPNGRLVQATARFEVGGTPKTNPEGYVLRSPTHWTRQIAASGVPLQMWWSTEDKVVTDQKHQSGALFDEIKRLRTRGRLDSVVGTWAHSHEMRFDTQLPQALVWLGLLPQT